MKKTENPFTFAFHFVHDILQKFVTFTEVTKG